MTAEMAVTALSIATGILAIVTFLNGRRKDSKSEGADEATIKADLQYIKSVLLDVRRETKEINALLDDHSTRLTSCEEKLKSAFNRIERIEHQIDGREK